MGTDPGCGPPCSQKIEVSRTEVIDSMASCLTWDHHLDTQEMELVLVGGQALEVVICARTLPAVSREPGRAGAAPPCHSSGHTASGDTRPRGVCALIRRVTQATDAFLSQHCCEALLRQLLDN